MLPASLAYGDRRFPVTLYSLDGIAATVGWDDLDDLVQRRKEPRPVEFYGENVIVIPTLIGETAVHAVENLAARREFDWLLRGA